MALRISRVLLTVFASLARVGFHTAQALDYPYTTAEPQKTGWPLTEEEKKYVLIAEHERRPGAEKQQHLPAMWPVTPSAGNWGRTSWQKHFGQYKTINIGIGGDKTQNVLWRLDHGGSDGLDRRLVVLLIGKNDMFFSAQTGIQSAAHGIKMCVANIREKFPKAEVTAVKVFPAHAPGVAFYEDIKKVNAALDEPRLVSDPKVHVLDLTSDLLNPDGAVKADHFAPDNIHLTQGVGYGLYAEKLKPMVELLLKP